MGGLRLSGTEIQGMMMGGWEEAATIQLGEEFHLYCLDGRVWEVRTEDGAVIGTFNPTNASLDEEIEQYLSKIMERGSDFEVYDISPPSD